ncbi:proline/serine-rich coiled-coil protein 1 [Crotalus tigris]|uniref:proline/serine-rich coiled-coil protein 1 n=1 Tax=Crotalus tigris TaxID=88082 RepID=UPI00192FB415|nr:proline/serine-rich coiled-coil protein 1 [Crotalus tigris]XP_039179178.1 proline/serine-rich coiled-coil protein 1 [Crotalus tigris]XP_039179179.1 proline/serine-rich coiled-coil protein 1 [Crotalus tigris]XP_039179180.1 proline/serine-rich coiled-coil protein 1 [Crotalus tigris]XP_039179181.1 proline/serine-rich coiled-coil protein 1 [Crotalus tigris]
MESSKDIKFITDETLDFELFSPLDGIDCCYRQEGESITCPLELNDKSVEQAVELNILLEKNDGKAREPIPQWSPLTPMKLEEVMKEANLLAMQLEKCQLLEKQNISSETKLETVLEHKLLPPIRFLCAETESPQTSRRKTFNVKNSPLKALLPTVEPVSCLAQDSPKALLSKDRNPSSHLEDLPSPRRLQNTSYVCSADVPQAKLSEPKALVTMTSGNKKLQATIRNSRTDKALVLPTTTKDQEPLLHLKPLPQTSIRKMLRKTEASAKNVSDQGSLVSSNKETVLAAQVKKKPIPQLRLLRTSPVKKIPVAPEKRVPLQKTNASQVKTMRGNGPNTQAISKPRGGSCQIQTRHTATSALASQLPVPKPINHTAAVLGRYAIPGKSSQFKPLSSETSGGQRSIKPTAMVGKKAACQKPVSPGTFQNSRMRLPKTTTSSSSK